jgi:anaerobic magnesium-protoporphyrin IX monomethyl ester cyclase
VCYVKASYPLRYVIFQDDTFVLKPKGWIERFCADYKARVGIPFMCTVRANVVEEEHVRLLADAGLRCVWTGVECGDEEVANRVLGRALRNEQIRKLTDLLHKHGVLIVATNLLGLPVPNSYETDLKTLDFNIDIRPVWGLAGLVYPFPKTPIRIQAEADGFLVEGQVPILDTDKRFTAFTFPDPREKRRVENLCKLFDLVVQHPRLRPYCDLLCGLPLGSLYTLLYYIRAGHTYKWKMFPFDSFWKEFWMWLRFLLRRIRRT